MVKGRVGGKYTRGTFMGIMGRVLMEQEKTRLEAQDACLLDEMRTKLNFHDIIGEF
ncbi:MAG: hypothetical protein ACREQ4_17000 [Candidatus Binataceae bacterium]